jgi:hypothetical protein
MSQVADTTALEGEAVSGGEGREGRGSELKCKEN